MESEIVLPAKKSCAEAGAIIIALIIALRRMGKIALRGVRVSDDPRAIPDRGRGQVLPTRSDAASHDRVGKRALRLYPI